MFKPTNPFNVNTSVVPDAVRVSTGAGIDWPVDGVNEFTCLNKNPGGRFTVATAVAAFAILVFSEITPKVAGARYPELIALPSSFLGGSAAAGGIALVVSIGQVGSFIGSTLIGVLRERTGDYGAAMAAIGIILALATLIALWLGRALSGRQQAPQAQASRAH